MKWGGIWSNSAGTDYGEYGSMYGVDSVSRDGFARNYAAAVTSFNGSSWISPAYGGAGFGAATDITDNGALVDFTLVRNATGIGQKLPPGKKAALHVFGRSATEFIRPYAPSDYDILEWSPEGGTWREPYEWNHIESFAAAQDTTKETRQLGRVGYENALPPGSDRSGDLVEGESYFQGYWVTYNPIHTDGVLKGNFGRNPTAILSWDNPDGFKFLRN